VSAPKRIPWTLVLFLIAALIPVFAVIMARGLGR